MTPHLEATASTWRSVTKTTPATSRAPHWVGVTRIVLGLQFIAFGVLKPLVPWIWEAWNQQLTQSNLPLFDIVRYVGPVGEIAAGLLLLTGFKARLGALVVVGMMVTAIYVHTQTDPEYLPLEIGPPIIPLATLFMAAIVLRFGNGNWAYKG